MLHYCDSLKLQLLNFFPTLKGAKEDMKARVARQVKEAKFAVVARLARISFTNFFIVIVVSSAGKI